MQYYLLIKDMSIKFNFRLRVVELAKETSISNAAKKYLTTRKTVRKWVRRYELYGLKGLEDMKRTPNYIPHKMKEGDEENIKTLRKKHPSWGARRFKERYGVNGSLSAIHRVIRQKCGFKKKKRRWRKRKDLSELKKKFKFFEFSQIDTKDLIDIYQYWPYIKGLGLPRYEYTLRELSTGANFFAYADENTSTNASLFAKYVIEHLKSYGIDTAMIKWQSDNGSEFIGNVKKKIKRSSAFEIELKKSHIEHMRIPPRCSYLQGDVETFHRIVEDELYEIESYRNKIDHLGKAYGYHLYFNYIRKNRYRDNQSPVEILRERFPEMDEGVLNLPPIRVDILLDENTRGGYHVPKPALSDKIFP